MNLSGFSFLLTAAFVLPLFAAVKPGENILLNGRLEADQVDFPPFWEADAKYFRYHKSGGPDGMPYVSVFGEKRPDVRMKQFGLNLASNGVYRMSLKVRARGLSHAHPSGLIVVNSGNWTSTAGILDLPADTAGEWRSVSQEFSCFRSAGGYYAMFYIQKQHGQIDIADFRLEAVDERALRETGPSKIIECQRRPRLVPFAPVLARIPADDPHVAFRFFGELEGRDADYEVMAVADGSTERVTAPLTREVMRIPLPAGATNGQIIVGIVHRPTGKRIVKNRYNFATVKTARKSSLRKKWRRLNNLATEVLSERVDSGATKRLAFALGRDGWAFLAVKGECAADFSARIDGLEVMTSETPRHETFRRLAAGEHALEIAGCAAGSVVVREIAEILNYCPGVNGVVAENPPYDWSFQERYVLPAVTTQLGGWIPPENREDFRRCGYLWLGNINLTGGEAQKMGTALSCALGHAEWDGVACDEQAHTDLAALDTYTQGFWEVDRTLRPSRLVYTWVYGDPASEPVASDFFAACLNMGCGQGKVLSEKYCGTRASEEDARRYIRTYIGDSLRRTRSWYPLALPSLGVVLGNFNQVPVLSLGYHPEVDYKYYLDMQMNYVANDPSCAGLGLVGYWGSYYADEELHRWSFALMRHYVVEGRTDMLSSAFGFSYLPGHVANGDFRGTLAPWKTKGEVRTDSFDGFAAKSQGRWGGNDGVGDTFAVLVRRKDGPSALAQTLKGLVPGRTYCLQFAAFDAKDVRASRVAPRRFAVSATLSNDAEINQSRSWVHVDARVKGRYAINDGVARINLHHILFTAKRETVELILDNESAAEGEELGVNFVSVNPYFPR